MFKTLEETDITVGFTGADDAADRWAPSGVTTGAGALGITENVQQWRTDVVARIASELGIDKVMFEAADPEVFAWVHQDPGTGGQPVRGSQPDRAARVPAIGHLGD